MEFYLFIQILMICFFCYLIGSFPIGLVLGKIVKNKDLRYLGSKSIGASNVARNCGFHYGLITTFLDILKSYLAIMLFQGTPFATYKIFFGLFIVLGHMYSVFANFKGGKAVNMVVGIVCAFDLLLGVSSMLFFLIMFMIFKYTSVASFFTILYVNLGLFFYTTPKLQSFESWIMLLISLFVILKHQQNIINLIHKKEYKFKF